MKITVPDYDLDRVLRTYRTPGDEITLRPGNWTTRGQWAHGTEPALAPGVTLIMMDGAKVTLEDPTLSPSHNWVPILWMGHKSRITGAGIWDLGGDIGKHGDISLSGFHALGSVELRTSLRGLRGFRPKGPREKEVFAFTQEPGDGSTVVSMTVMNSCDRGPDSYASGIYLNDHGAVCENSVVSLGDHDQFAYSCAGLGFFRNCRGHASRLVYTDTGDMEFFGDRLYGSATWAAVGTVCTGGQPLRRMFLRQLTVKVPEGRLAEIHDDGPLANQDALIHIEGGAVEAKWRSANVSKRGDVIFSGVEIKGEGATHGREPIVW